MDAGAYNLGLRKCMTVACLVQVQHHLLWVWADASPNAQLECLSKQPAIIQELQNEDEVLYMHPWYAQQTCAQMYA